MKSALEDYEVRLLTNFPEPEFSTQRKAYLRVPGRFRWKSLLDQAEKERVATARARFKTQELRLGVFLNNELVGWTFGRAEGPSRFKMLASVVVEKHQKKGIYSMLLGHVLTWTKSEGYEEVVSLHRALNSAILIAKLKGGFNIAGMEVSDVHGVLVRLSYLHREIRQDAFNQRCG